MIKQIIIYVILAATGVAIGRFTLPAKITEKEVIKYVDRIVEKKVLVKDETQKRNRIYVKLTTVKPDGTKTTETKIFDNNQIEITQTASSITDEHKTIDQSKEKEIKYNTGDYLVSGAIKLNLLNSPTSGYDWGIILNRRLIGPIYMGGFGFSDKTFGAGLGLRF